MKGILNLLRTKGYRLTTQRRILLEQMDLLETPFSAYELWLVAKAHDASLALDTVYRNLALLYGVGYLLIISGTGKEGARYEIAADLGHHHHIVCERCGAARCLDYCPVDDALLQQVKQCGYELRQHQIELVGLCHNCLRGGAR